VAAVLEPEAPGEATVELPEAEEGLWAGEALEGIGPVPLDAVLSHAGAAVLVHDGSFGMGRLQASKPVNCSARHASLHPLAAVAFATAALHSGEEDGVVPKSPFRRQSSTAFRSVVATLAVVPATAHWPNELSSVKVL
jgi:hypothetical protein